MAERIGLAMYIISNILLYCGIYFVGLNKIEDKNWNLSN